MVILVNKKGFRFRIKSEGGKASFVCTPSQTKKELKRELKRRGLSRRPADYL